MKNETLPINESRLIPSYAIIQLMDGGTTIVDHEDYESLRQHNWRRDKNGYIHSRIDGKWIFIHRYVMSPPSHLFIDHIDSDKLNNQKHNLRLCTVAQNNKNYSTPSTNTSGFKGVHWSKSNKKWIARIKVDTKRVYIGSFECKVEAAMAYNNASIKFHGEFGRLNSIP